MAPRASSKIKGKKPMREDSPPHFDHSGYPSRHAFNRYSTRNINYGRILNFQHLHFMDFNLLMRRIKWLTFARIRNPSYPSLVRRFYGNLINPYKGSMHLVSTLEDTEIELDPSYLWRILSVNDEGDEVFDINSWPIVENFNPQAILRRLCKPNSLNFKP